MNGRDPPRHSHPVRVTDREFLNFYPYLNNQLIHLDVHFKDQLLRLQAEEAALEAEFNSLKFSDPLEAANAAAYLRWLETPASYRPEEPPAVTIKDISRRKPEPNGEPSVPEREANGVQSGSASEGEDDDDGLTREERDGLAYANVDFSSGSISNRTPLITPASLVAARNPPASKKPGGQDKVSDMLDFAEMIATREKPRHEAAVREKARKAAAAKSRRAEKAVEGARARKEAKKKSHVPKLRVKPKSRAPSGKKAITSSKPRSSNNASSRVYAAKTTRSGSPSFGLRDGEEERPRRRVSFSMGSRRERNSDDSDDDDPFSSNPRGRRRSSVASTARMATIGGPVARKSSMKSEPSKSQPKITTATSSTVAAGSPPLPKRVPLGSVSQSGRPRVRVRVRRKTPPSPVADSPSPSSSSEEDLKEMGMGPRDLSLSPTVAELEAALAAELGATSRDRGDSSDIESLLASIAAGSPVAASGSPSSSAGSSSDSSEADAAELESVFAELESGSSGEGEVDLDRSDSGLGLSGLSSSSDSENNT